MDFYRCNGPSLLPQEILIDRFDQFGLAGYYAMLLGQRVSHDAPARAHRRERAAWSQRARQGWNKPPAGGLGVAEALAAVRAPDWKWEASG